MAYVVFKDLNRRTFADKLLHDKAFNIAKDLRYHGYQRGLPSMVYKFFDKKSSGSGIKNENISNKEFGKELHKPILKNVNNRKVHSPFIEKYLGCRFSRYAISK